MVHYIRFLKPPQVINSGAGAFAVTTLITIETDLGENFLHSEATLDVCVILASGDEPTIHRQESLWRHGIRELSLRVAVSTIHENRNLRLHVSESGQLQNSIAPVLAAWSGAFRLAQGCRADSVIERRFSLPRSPPLKIWEETGNSIARHIWDAALGWLLFLEKDISAEISTTKKILAASQDKRAKVIELGAGCGIVGIAIAQLFPNCEVELTDQQEAQALLLKNSEQSTPAPNCSLSSRILDWESKEDPFGSRAADSLRLIVVSDCTYNADSCPNLVQTLAQLSSQARFATIVVAMKRRHDSEEVFFRLMEDANMRVSKKCMIALPVAAESYPAGVADSDVQIELFWYVRTE